MSRRNKKTLIEPKVRLLLSIYLNDMSKKSNWRNKLEKDLACGKGNLSTYLTDLVDDGLIESQNPNGTDPPLKVTAQGKKFLGPIIFTSRIGMFILSWVGIWVALDYVIFAGQPVIVASIILPLIIFSFLALALILMLYPYLLLKGGKTHYR
jgi:hypothetical protein